MTFQNKHLAALFAVSILVIAGGIAAYNPLEQPETEISTQSSEEPMFKSLEVVRVNGEVINRDTNYFTDNGRDWLIGQVGDVSSDGNTYGATTNFVDTIHVGKHPGGSASSLTTQDFTSTVTWNYNSLGNISTSHEFTATSEVTVNGTSSESSNNGVIFSTNTFDEVTLQDDDKINVTKYIWAT